MEVVVCYNLVLMADRVEELTEKVVRRKEFVEAKGLTMNTGNDVRKE